MPKTSFQMCEILNDIDVSCIFPLSISCIPGKLFVSLPFIVFKAGCNKASVVCSQKGRLLSGWCCFVLGKVFSITALHISDLDTQSCIQLYIVQCRN